MRTLTSKPAIMIALACTLGLAIYQLWNACTIPVADRQVGVLDARYLTAAALGVAVLYVAHYREDKVRKAWLAMLTITTWGRALDLWFNGSESLTRTQEAKGFMVYVLLFGFGLTTSYLLSASVWLYGPSGSTRPTEGG